MSIKRVRVRRERKIKEREEERIKEQLAIFKSVKKDRRYNWQKLELNTRSSSCGRRFSK